MSIRNARSRGHDFGGDVNEGWKGWIEKIPSWEIREAQFMYTDWGSTVRLSDQEHVVKDSPRPRLIVPCEHRKSRFGVILDTNDDGMQRGGDRHASQRTAIVNIDRDD